MRPWTPHLPGFVVGLFTGILGNAAILVIPQPFRDGLGYFGVAVYLLAAAALVWRLLHVVWARAGLTTESLNALQGLIDRLMLPAVVAFWIGVLALFGPAVLGFALVLLIAVSLLVWVLSALIRWWRRHAPK